MSIDKKYKKLINKLFIPFIFYIPSSYISADKKEYFEKPEVKVYLDKVWVLDKDGHCLGLKSNPKLFHLMSRASILNENMFNLLEFKDKMKPFQFKYLLESYQSQIHMYVAISRWLYDNVNDTIPNLGDSIKNYFIMQKNAFQMHYDKLEAHFSLNSSIDAKSEDIIKHIKDYVPPIKQFFGSKLDVDNIVNKAITNTLTKKKKAILISDEESRQFLLETVFKV